jgi:hypothetical protein
VGDPANPGSPAVFLNNYHFAYTAWPTVTFDAPYGVGH